MKTLFLASTLFLSEIANTIAIGIDKLDWQQHSKKSGINVLSTNVPDSSLMLFRNGEGMQISDPFATSYKMLFTSHYRDIHGRAVGNQALATGVDKSIDIASINFLVPKQKNIRYEKGAIVWEVKL